MRHCLTKRLTLRESLEKVEFAAARGTGTEVLAVAIFHTVKSAAVTAGAGSQSQLR